MWRSELLQRTLNQKPLKTFINMMINNCKGKRLKDRSNCSENTTRIGSGRDCIGRWRSGGSYFGGGWRLTKEAPAPPTKIKPLQASYSGKPVSRPNY
jgi:hypothetical protein